MSNRDGLRITFPAEARQIVDVTQPPYSADPTGERDCTQALIRALDDIVAIDREGFREWLEYFQKNPFSSKGLPEARKDYGLVYPPEPPPARILYFPGGTYLVSDTIRYSFRDLQNSI
ncbi:MAG: hypothetical protein PVJ27_02825, partial [Candidatus Brocadiaceae bacterium]